jgi:CHAT domain-containing protein/tetratricopeptide (TPR) repeat protein
MRLILFNVFLCCALYLQSQPGKLLNIAEASSAAGRYAESNELLGHFMAQYPSRLYDKGRALWFKSYNHLQQNEFDAALDANAASLALMEQFIPEGLSPNYFRFGEIYLRLGQYEQALSYLFKADAYPLMDEPLLAAAIKDKIGQAYSALGQFRRARPYFQAAIATLVVEADEPTPQLGDSYFHLGQVYFKEGELEAAAQQFEKALAAEEALEGEAWRISRALNALGKAAQAAGRQKEAEQFYMRAFEQCLDQGMLHELEAVKSLLYIAQLELQAGKLPEAQAQVKRALELNCPGHGAENAASAPCLSRLLTAEAMQTKAAIALAAFERDKQPLNLEQALAACLRGVTALEEESNLLAGDAASFFLPEEYRGLYESGMLAAALLHQETNQAAYAKQAFDLSERAHALALRIQRNSRETALGPKTGLEQHARQLRLALRTAENNYARQQQEFATNKHADRKQQAIRTFARQPEYPAAKKTFSLHRQAYQSFLDSLREMAPDYYRQHFGFTTANIPALQQQLGPQRLLLSYFLGEKKYFIFAISSQSFQLWQLDKSRPGKPGMDELTTGFLRALKTENAAEFATFSHELYRLLIEPAASALKKKSQLIIAPHGQLTQLPFEALISSPVKDVSKIKYDKMPYLAAAHRIQYCPSASWQANGQLLAPQAVGEGMLALAPGFGDNNSIPGTHRYLFDTVFQSLPSLLAVAPDGKHFARLPNAADELSKIADLFSAKGKKVSTLIGTEATEEAFKMHPASYRYLHLATHGFTHQLNPTLSGIAFSPPDGESPEDGILFAPEISRLALQGQLVVLSPVHSANSSGLPICLPFLEAGAAQVLVSRWHHGPLADQLFPAFYRYLLKGLPPGEALHQTQLEWLSNKETAAPWIWGSLVLWRGGKGKVGGEGF